MKMNFLNVPLCNGVTNWISKKQANKKWWYEVGLLSHGSFHFHWICHIHQRHYLQDYWTRSMATDIRWMAEIENESKNIYRLVVSWLWHAWYLIAVLDHFVSKTRLWYLIRVSRPHPHFREEQKEAKEATKEWLIYEAGLLNHGSFHFHWICHIKKRHYLQDYWALSMVTDTKKTRLTIVIKIERQVKLENAMKIAWRSGSERRVGFEPFYK